jgi:CreA protein
VSRVLPTRRCRGHLSRQPGENRRRQGSFGLAQDPSQFSLACRQTGPITLPAKLPKDATVFSEDTSILFKETRVVRMWDETHRTLVYLAISRKLIDGAPANSISTVPVMPWGGR